VFEYSGNLTAASQLLAATSTGAETIRVLDPSLYASGRYVYIADVVGAPSEIPDGASEVRRVKSIAGDTLTLDRPLKRGHQANVQVALATPIFGPVFRKLTFSGDAHVGIHLEVAQEARVEGIRSTNWGGGVLVLLDNGGYRNMINDCHATGTAPGILAPGTNTWGIAVEGQDETTIFNSGGSKAYVGVLIQQSIDTWAYWTTATDNALNVVVGSDNSGNGSIRSGFRFGQSARGILAGASIGRNCLDCEVSLDLVDNRNYDVSVATGANRTRVGLGNHANRTQSVCGVIIYPNQKGPTTTTTVDLQVPDCRSRTNICRRISGVGTHTSVTVGPYATSCAATGASTQPSRGERRPVDRLPPTSPYRGGS
jgi:hypothetical protein